MEVGLFQKIIGTVLALLLVLGVVPVGLLYFATPVIAEDSVIRLAPTDETFVYSGAKNKSRERLDNENLIVGNYWNTYFKFDLTPLGNVKRADLRGAKLRLAVVDTGMISPESRDATFNVSYVDNNNWNEGMTWDSRPMGEEQYLCTAGGAESGGVLEIDLSEFTAETAGFEDKVITIKLSPSLSNSAPVRLGSTSSPDPSYRPYLKIVVGDAPDNDPSDLKKSQLTDCGYVSAARPDEKADELTRENDGLLAVDNGSAAYLKFGLNLQNIIGAVTSAELRLRPVNGAVNTITDVYGFENDGWNSGNLSYASRPEGTETEIRSFPGIDSDGLIRIDVTDMVYDAAAKGKPYVSFILDGTRTPAESTDTLLLRSSYSDSGAPELKIICTDDPETVAIREALANLKGSNASFDDITADLPSEYTASNGERVIIRWSENDNFSFGDLLTMRKKIVTGSGRVNPPSVFEGAKRMQVKAELSCGGDSLSRLITITVRPDIGSPGRLRRLYDALWQNDAA